MDKRRQREQNREDKMTEIYLAKTHLLIRSGYGDPQMHSHSACHIITGLHGDIRVCAGGESVMCSGAFVPSGVSHTVDGFGSPLLVFMFDITSKVSEKITDFKELEKQETERIVSAWQQWETEKNADDYENFFKEVMMLTGMCDTGSRVSDERIAEAMRFVKEHLNDDVTVKDAAESVYLSESRFSHLFREETGISFSGYMLMQKIFCAYMQIAEGRSITEAAVAAGFSTPSHFATVNKKMFGITARDLSGDHRLYKLADI